MIRRSSRPRRPAAAPDLLVGPLVVIVGRPNVGKSTLFNRLVRSPVAVVGPEEGTTRDRHYAGAEWNGHRFVVADTGGFAAFDDGRMMEEIKRQVLFAVKEADLVLFAVEAQPGPTDLDLALARLLRRAAPNVMVAATKVDRPADEAELHRFLALGLGEAVPVSALHGRGIAELLEAVVGRMPETAESPDDAGGRVRVAVVGRPNVGKSSLVNRLLGEERMIVDDVAGTTRDAVDTRLEVGADRFILVDTAGLRRQARREPGVEYWSALRSERAIARSDVVILVLEASEAGATQDARIASLADELGRGIIMVVNKWDLVPFEDRQSAAWEKHLRREFRFIPYAPLLFVSAATGIGVARLLPLAAAIARERGRRLEEDHLESLLGGAVRARPPTHQGRRGVLYAARQLDTCPPRFALYVNDPLLFSSQYMRYLQNRVREKVPFEGTPIRLDLKRGRPVQEGAGANGPRGRSRRKAAR